MALNKTQYKKFTFMGHIYENVSVIQDTNKSINVSVYDLNNIRLMTHGDSIFCKVISHYGIKATDKKGFCDNCGTCKEEYTLSNCPKCGYIGDLVYSK